MYQSYFDLDEKDRELEAIDAQDALALRGNRDYLDGDADAALGYDPRHPENFNYWRGYQESLREQWMRKLGYLSWEEF